jgi:hypothetical protein
LLLPQVRDRDRLAERRLVELVTQILHGLMIVDGATMNREE